MSSIIDAVKDFFGVGKDDKPEKPPLPMPKAGQDSYKSQATPVAVQHQEVSTKLSPIPVEVGGIVPVWNLPSKIQTIKQSGTYGVAPNVLINGSYKIKRVLMWATVSGLYVGTEQDIKSNGFGYAVTLPANVPIELTGLTEDLWFAQSQASVTANQAQPIYYAVEYWLD